MRRWFVVDRHHKSAMKKNTHNFSNSVDAVSWWCKQITTAAANRGFLQSNLHVRNSDQCDNDLSCQISHLTSDRDDEHAATALRCQSIRTWFCTNEDQSLPPIDQRVSIQAQLCICYCVWRRQAKQLKYFSATIQLIADENANTNALKIENVPVNRRKFLFAESTSMAAALLPSDFQFPHH